MLVSLLPTIICAETIAFQSENSRLLDIIIHSLYSKKEIFLREAISNSSDALNKIRFRGLSHKNELSIQPDLKITLKTNKELNQLIIEDTGVGMTKEEMIENLGTIAKSGTTEFLKKVEQSNNMGIIGQFGVGFYSYFLVASQVTVVSKSYHDDQYIW